MFYNPEGKASNSVNNYNVRLLQNSKCLTLTENLTKEVQNLVRFGYVIKISGLRAHNLNQSP